MEKRQIKSWITIKHRHIPIFEGENTQDAINRFKEGVRKGKQTAPIPSKQYIKKRDAAEKAVNALEQHQKRVDSANERIKTDTSADAQKEKLNADRTFKEAMQRYSTRRQAFDAIKDKKQIKSYEFRKKQVDKELSEKQDQISRTSQISEQMNNTSSKEPEYDSNFKKWLDYEGGDVRGALQDMFEEHIGDTWQHGNRKYDIHSENGSLLRIVKKATPEDPYVEFTADVALSPAGKDGPIKQMTLKDPVTNEPMKFRFQMYKHKETSEPIEPKIEPPKPKEPEYERTPKMDWIEKRIEGKQAELNKLEKKMERINKAKESDYKENNPYYYSDYDFRVTTKDIENAKKSLQDYKDQMEKEIEKAKSRNVPVITEFLDDWEQKSIEYFKEHKKKYDEEALPNYRKRDKEYVDWLNYPYKYVEGWDRTNPAHLQMYREKDKEHTEYRKFFKSNWHFVTQFNDGQGTWEENMRNAVRKEKYAKYDDIITRTNDLIGQITDAGGLHIGKKGDLNGVIIGSKGKATVETIGAGGYNIQRYHFRTLIHELREKK